MNPDQTNTRQGPFPAIAAADLTGFRSRLVEIGNNAGVLQVSLPNANADFALYQLEEDGVAGALLDVHPIQQGEQRRVVLKGTCNPGDSLVLADIATPADKGKLRTLPVGSGTYRVLALAEEIGIDGQLVKARFQPIGNIVVP